MDRKIILDCSRADRRDRAAAVLRGAVVAAAMLISDPAAAETPAGTSIVNTAALRYDLAGTAQEYANNNPDAPFSRHLTNLATALVSFAGPLS